MRVHGLEPVLLGQWPKSFSRRDFAREVTATDWRLTCSGADLLIGDMCCESDVQDISQAPLVEGTKTSFGRYVSVKTNK